MSKIPCLLENIQSNIKSDRPLRHLPESSERLPMEQYEYCNMFSRGISGTQEP